MKYTVIQFATIAVAFLLFCTFCLLVAVRRTDFMMVGPWTFEPVTLVKFLTALLLTLYYLGALISHNDLMKFPQEPQGHLQQEAETERTTE